MIMLIIHLLLLWSPSLVLTDTIIQDTSQCDFLQTISLKGNWCNRKSSGQYMCKLATQVNIPLATRNHVNCGHILSLDGKTLSALKIIMTDFKYKCVEQSLYYTGSIHYDYEVYWNCWNVKPCKGNFCDNANINSTYPTWGKPEMALENRFCEYGSGSPRYACTSTCHYIRAWPVLKSEPYRVTRCIHWIPKVDMVIKWITNNEVNSYNVELENEQSKRLTSNITIKLVTTGNDVYSILNDYMVIGANNAFQTNDVNAGTPVKYELGMVQCPTRYDLNHMTKNCTHVSKPCDARGHGDRTTVFCSGLNMSSIADANAKIKIGDLPQGLSLYKDKMQFRPIVNGIGRLEVTVKGIFVSNFDDDVQCSVKLMNISGCHSCKYGAYVTYTCKSNARVQIDGECSDDVRLFIECMNNTLTRNAIFYTTKKELDATCSFYCSKEISFLVGTLETVSLTQGNYHIQTTVQTGGNSDVFDAFASIFIGFAESVIEPIKALFSWINFIPKLISSLSSIFNIIIKIILVFLACIVIILGFYVCCNTCFSTKTPVR